MIKLLFGTQVKYAVLSIWKAFSHLFFPTILCISIMIPTSQIRQGRLRVKRFTQVT